MHAGQMSGVPPHKHCAVRWQTLHAACTGTSINLRPRSIRSRALERRRVQKLCTAASMGSASSQELTLGSGS